MRCRSCFRVRRACFRTGGRVLLAVGFRFATFATFRPFFRFAGNCIGRLDTRLVCFRCARELTLFRLLMREDPRCGGLRLVVLRLRLIRLDGAAERTRAASGRGGSLSQ